MEKIKKKMIRNAKRLSFMRKRKEEDLKEKVNRTRKDR